MDDCIFCKIITGDIPSTKVYEDDELLAFLDIRPVNPGHTLVIPKVHHKNLSETPPDVAAAMMRIVPSLSKAVMKAVNASAFNLGVNNGVMAGQEVDHVHLHIMPRQEGDGYEIWHGQEYENQEEANRIADSIRAAMS